MTPVSVQFLFDFGSPNAYLCHRVIPDIEARSPARFDYVPILLGGLFKLANNRSPMEAYGGIPNKWAYQQKEMQRFIERHRLTAYKRNPHFPVNTLHLMRGAIAAQRLECYEQYIEAMFVAMWEQEKKMDDPDVIRAELTAAGLDADALMKLSQDAGVKAELIANTEQAHANGAFGSPSFMVGGELYFGKERLRDIEEVAAEGSGSARNN